MALKNRPVVRYLILTLALLASAQRTAAATVQVRAGDNLQAALDAAQPGDVLLLEAGATFTGNFTLPVKTGTDIITVRSSAADADLPGAGRRIAPAYASRLPKIVSTNSLPSLRAAAGAHHWRLQFLDFPSTQLGYGEILRIGEASSAQTLLSQVPYEIELDRIYMHGHPLYGQKRGIALNGRSITIRNSYIADIKAVGFDSQAIAGWNGPGPFTIENNYLEAAGENMMIGGSDPAIANLVSEQIVVRRNHMTKPMAWRAPVIDTPASVAATPGTSGTLPAGTYGYRVVARRPVGGGTNGRSTASAEVTTTIPATGSVTVTWGAVADAVDYRVYGRTPGGSSLYWTVTGTSFTDTGSGGAAGAAPTSAGDMWSVKNIFELKNARQVVVEFNVFENNWAASQPGYGILFTPRNQDGNCPWCTVQDVTFQYNIVRNSTAGINLTGYDSPNPSVQAHHITIRHNLFTGISQSLGGSGWFLLIGDEPRDVIVDHNTIDHDGTALVYAHGGSSTVARTITGFQFTNNAARHNAYGINSENASFGNGALARYFPNAVVTGNWLQGGSASKYPAGNVFTGTYAVAFANTAAGDYRTASPSVLLTGSTDGLPIGADIEAILAGIQGVTVTAPAPRAPGALVMSAGQP